MGWEEGGVKGREWRWGSMKRGGGRKGGREVDGGVKVWWGREVGRRTKIFRIEGVSQRLWEGGDCLEKSKERTSWP